MDAVTIDEPRKQAREKYAEYLRAVRQRHSAEDELLRKAYLELSRGRQVLDLVATMREAGLDHLDRPRLAIVRADARLCWCRLTESGGALFTLDGDFYDGRKSSRKLGLPAGTFTPAGKIDPWRTLRAVVPTIPPDLRPAGTLTKYHILWEAEWETIPRDPMLLRRLGRGLYCVLAAWDLTPLERAVLGNR